VAVLVVRYESSDAVHRIRFDPAAAPFERHGRPGSVLDVILGHGLWLEHACGGNAACTTCHVVVLRGAQWLSAIEEDEDDMLDQAVGLTPASRLGCQAVIGHPDADVAVLVPRFTVHA
jgi:2Fe-2S ferredoxin